MRSTRRGGGGLRGKSRGASSNGRSLDSGQQDLDELNADINERVGRNGNRRGQEKTFTQSKPLPTTNQQVGRYLRKKKPIGVGAPAWTLRPDIPSVEELLPYSTFETVPAPLDAQSDWLDAPPDPLAANSHGVAGWDDTAGPQTWDDLEAAETSRGPEEDAKSNAAEVDSTTKFNGSGAEKAQSDLIGGSQPRSPPPTPPPADHHSEPDGSVMNGSATRSIRSNAENNGQTSRPKGNYDVNSAQLQKAKAILPIDPAKPAWDDTGAEGDAWASVAVSADPWLEDTNPEAATADWNECGAQQAETEYGDWGTSNNNSTSNAQADAWEWPAAEDTASHNRGWNARTRQPRYDDWEPGASVDENDEGFGNVINKISGPWNSKMEYLRNHYLLLREDSLRNLRNGLQFVRANSDITESLSTHGLGIYDQVHICGITFSNRGLGIRVSFSLGKVGKKVRWEQSPRLKSGSLIVLMSPEKTVTKVGVVAGRHIDNLNKDPPEVDLFLARAEDLDLDCAKEWIMIEERSAYFEAQRHTMVALQRMAEEQFPLQEYLVEVQQSVDSPAYLAREPVRNLTPLFDNEVPPADCLKAWPREDSELDESQMTAVQTILTKKLALVQGPPGTGKTHVSVQALKVLLANMAPNDPPIIITCQTNHALDQLLRHVSDFESQFARLGGRTKDMEIVGKRTIFELGRSTEIRRWTGLKDFLSIVGEMEKLITPLVKNDPKVVDTLGIDLLQELGVLTGLQHKSLVDATKEMVVHDSTPGATDPIVLWVGTRNLEPVQVRRQPILLEWEDYEVEEEQEEVGEAEAEAGVKQDDEDFERLPGDYFMIGDTWTGKGGRHPAASRRAEELLSKTTDLYKIRSSERGIVYCYLQQQAKLKISERLRELWPKYYQAVESRNVHKFESQEVIARGQKVVGMTTTGLSKYRGLVAALRPKIVLIEEAAETLEAPVIAACVESLEHLILVGDHKQLRPHCNVNDLSLPPYHLNISLFERLVDNGVHYSLLRRQRRMKPEIRRLINPIYGDKIKDHKSVRERPPVPGMGGLTTWFLTHDMTEDRDHEFSAFNTFEVDMIFGLVQYLLFNGMKDRHITVLTFYRAQVRALTRKLKSYPSSVDVRVVTVDSYQGEENDVVILSLVRSNLDYRIGFVGNENRICVALSRAKRGFYIFGNGQMLATESRIWSEVLSDVYNGSVGKSVKEPDIDPRMINSSLPRRRIGYALPLWCARHKRMSFIRDPQEWNRNVGGCDLWCRATLKCGHRCLERCHPWSHEVSNTCKMRCPKIMGCGHPCSFLCRDFQHACIKCEKQRHQKAWEEPEQPVESEYDDANFTKPVLGPLVEIEPDTLYTAPSPEFRSLPVRAGQQTHPLHRHKEVEEERLDQWQERGQEQQEEQEQEQWHEQGQSQQQQQDLRMGRLLEGRFDDIRTGGDGYTYDQAGRPVLQGQQDDTGTTTASATPASLQSITPLSPAQHYDAVYNADRHARAHANGQHSPRATANPDANEHGMNAGAGFARATSTKTHANASSKDMATSPPLHPRRFVGRTGSEGARARPSASAAPRRTSGRPGSSSRGGVRGGMSRGTRDTGAVGSVRASSSPSVTSASAVESEGRDTEVEAEPEVDLLGDEGEVMVPVNGAAAGGMTSAMADLSLLD